MTRSVSVFATCGVAALLALASGCASAPAGKQIVKIVVVPDRLVNVVVKG